MSHSKQLTIMFLRAQTNTDIRYLVLKCYIIIVIILSSFYGIHSRYDVRLGDSYKQQENNKPCIINSTTLDLDKICFLHRSFG